MGEVSLTLAFVKARAAALAPGGFYFGTAPPGVTAPFILMQPYGGPGDVSVIGGVRVWSQNWWLIEAWGQTSDYADVLAAADALDAALQKSAGSAAGGTVLACVRLRPSIATEIVQGVAQWVRAGGVYQIDAQAS